MDVRPKLLVQWEPRGRRFWESCAIVFKRSPGLPKLHGVDGTISPRGPLISALLHCGFVFTMLWVVPQLTPYLPQAKVHLNPLLSSSSETIVYYSPHLPGMEDAQGAESGRAGRAGGRSINAEHAIRTAPLAPLANKHVDAPKLRLPNSRALMANIVALPTFVPPAPPVDVAATHNVHTPTVGIVAPPRPQVVAPPPAPEQPPVIVRSDVDPSSVRKLVAPSADPGAPQLALSKKSQLPTALTALPTASKPEPPKQPRSVAALTSNSSPLEVVVTSDPGNSVGTPNAGPGIVAMSPKGHAPVGTGGTGGGTGVGEGSGPGASTTGTGPGAATTGNGVGSANAKSGVTAGPGPGGAGHQPGGTTGVAINGPVVFLPSFGGPQAGTVFGTPTSGATPRPQSRPPSVVVIASGRSGGGLNVDFAPKGNRVYTIYVDTKAGTAVVQYAGTQTAFDGDLTAPQPVSTDVPGGIKPSRTLISCVLDRFGALRDLHVLRREDEQVAAKLLEALAHWQFRPVLYGGQPVDVKTVIGFGVGTR